MKKEEKNKPHVPHLSTLSRAQNDFHQLLNSYFSGALFSPWQRHLFPSYVFKAAARKHARKIIDEFKLLERNLHTYLENTYRDWEPSAAIPSSTSSDRVSSPENPYVEEKIKVAPYTGRNPAVIRLRDYLKKNMFEFLLGAFLHGSLATDEEKRYSDFDALLVFSNKIFEDESLLVEVCLKEIKALRILYDYDPLQHHGFFILTALDLDFYCEEYFPRIIFDYSKSLLADRGKELRLRIRPSDGENIKAFKAMARACREKIKGQKLPRNYYELKSLLSGLMLLPSLYLQTKGMCVFKKHSFRLTARDFPSSTWKAMEKASLIREEWDFSPSPLFQKLKRAVPNPFFALFWQKKLGKPISENISSHLTPEFYSGMLELIQKMESQAENGSN